MLCLKVSFPVYGEGNRNKYSKWYHVQYTISVSFVPDG